MINFYRGLEENYSAELHGGGIYQCSDTGNTYVFGVLNWNENQITLDYTADLAGGNGTISEDVLSKIQTALSNNKIVVVRNNNDIFPLVVKDDTDTITIHGLSYYEDSQYNSIQYYEYVITKATRAIVTNTKDIPHFTSTGEGTQYLSDDGTYKELPTKEYVDSKVSWTTIE